MQKKLIALAVAGLVSGAAFAQSNVTIYGIADAAFATGTVDRGTTTGGDGNFNGISSGGWSTSRLGFKGEEGLGNGLKAIFTLEYGVSLDSGATLGANRQQFVGLQSDKLGKITLGNQMGPANLATYRNDITGAANLVSGQLGTSAATRSASGAARLKNSVMYVSPNFSGFTIATAFSYAEANSPTTTSNGVGSGASGGFDLGANYANGPLNLDLYWRNISDDTAGGFTQSGGNSSSFNPTGDSINEWGLGGTYDFKVVKIAGLYQDRNDSNGTSAQDGGSKSWNIGISAPVFGNGTIYANYGGLSWDRSGMDGADVWSLAYTHSLSKRTMLYAGYTAVKNDRDVVNAATINGVVGGLGVANETASGFGAGVRHTF